MTSLIACLSTGKGSWTKLGEIINSAEWDNIFLITNDFGKEKFQSSKKVELIVLDLNQSPDLLMDQIIAGLHGKNLGNEVAINISSGTGNEHMALLAAILKLGLGMRLVFSRNGVAEELKLFNSSFG